LNTKLQSPKHLRNKKVVTLINLKLFQGLFFWIPLSNEPRFYAF
jgi:hypothetical protein